MYSRSPRYRHTQTGSSLDPVIDAGRLTTIPLNAISVEPLAGPVERLATSQQYVTLGKVIGLPQQGLCLKLHLHRGQS